jgi:hypothetical protein
MNEKEFAARQVIQTRVISATSSNPEQGIRFSARPFSQNLEVTYRPNEFPHFAGAPFNVPNREPYCGRLPRVTADTGWSKGKAKCI